MSLTSYCGHHCGIRSNAEGTFAREGHCDCGQCHDGGAPIVITREDLTAALRGTPMCDRWYERAGDYRPWHYVRPSLSDMELISVEIRPDAVPYEQTPPSTMANDAAPGK